MSSTRKYKALGMRIIDDIRGFTLIEILIATVIITVASLGVANLTVLVMHGNSFSKHMTTATALGQDRLEHAKRINYTDVETLVGTEDYGSIVNYTGYKRITSISNNTPMANMKTMNVTVYWDFDKYSIKLSTILAE